jgi:hypothetical protein
MRISIKFARVIVLLIAVVAVPIALASIAGRVVGERVYLLNSSLCRVAVMDQHNGSSIHPGETALVKHGFLDRTPNILIVAEGDIWFGGLHFGSSKLEIRGQDDIVIPRGWLETSWLGSSLTYELTAKGELILRSPKRVGSYVMSQPAGLPATRRLGSLSSKCTRA